jgi:uncharacterized membrane protein
VGVVGVHYPEFHLTAGVVILALIGLLPVLLAVFMTLKEYQDDEMHPDWGTLIILGTGLFVTLSILAIAYELGLW